VALCAVLAVLAVLAVPLVGMPAASAAVQKTAPRSAARHVVIVGISGLRWNQVTPSATPELWRLASGGSVGSLVDYAQQPLACPADGWLTLNAAARVQGPRPCTPLPEVVADGGGARVPAMPGLVRANEGYHESPDWGLLGSLASCATAVGPGAALALASPAGAVSSYLPSAGELSAVVLARCPLTVVDLGQTGDMERSRVSAIDRQLAKIAAELPADTLLLVISPGAAVAGRAGGLPTGPPHLMATVVSGAGFADGLLDSSSTRRPGIVTLTDLTPTVAGWLGAAVPEGIVGARIGRTGRSGTLASTVRTLLGRDTAEQVWMATHGWFFTGYAVAGAVAFGLPALIFWGADSERRRRRARSWRIAGILAAAVPLGSFLANLAPWWRLAHPAWWLYGMAVAWTLAVAAVALAGPWRRDALGPFGVICLATLAVPGVDVMTGSRLQLDAPFGLSLLVSGRYYGIGNDVLGVYCVSALVGAAWLGMLAASDLSSRSMAGALAMAGSMAGAGSQPPTVNRSIIRGIISFLRLRDSVLAVGLVGLFAVVASGWPGFGAKVGGTIALVPCLLLLIVTFAGGRVGWRWAAPVAVSGLALFTAFAVASYFFPAVGVSDLGTFAGNLLHGGGGDVLKRKVSSNVGTLTVSAFSWLIPVAAVAAGIALWLPSALRLRTLSRAFEAVPLVRVVAWLCWLVLVIGWLADDSGVIGPAVALPFAVPLVVSIAVSVSTAAGGGGYRGTAFTGSSVAGRPPRYDQPPR